MHRKHVLLGYVAIVVAAPIVVWWLLPDMSAEGGTDHIVEPPDIPDAVRLTIGLGASAMLVVGGAVVFSPTGRTLRRPGDAPTVIPLMLGGAYVGFTYRAATAAVIGANIGGGMFIMAGMILVPTLVLYSTVTAAVNAWRRRRTRRQLQRGNGATIPRVGSDMAAARATTSAMVDWRIVVPLGVVSVVTMPLSAIWFLLLALLTFVATAISGAVARSPHRADGIVQTGMSIGLGLLPGPVIYLTLAALV